MVAEGRGYGERRRTRADREFLRARPAALRTWGGEASLTSSVESIITYAGWIRGEMHDERGGPRQMKMGMGRTNKVLASRALELLGGIVTRVCVCEDEEGCK